MSERLPIELGSGVGATSELKQLLSARIRAAHRNVIQAHKEAQILVAEARAIRDAEIEQARSAGMTQAEVRSLLR